MNLLALAPLVLAATSAVSTASADPAPSLKVDVDVSSGAFHQTYQLVLAERSCGELQDKSQDHEVKIHLCSETRPEGTRLEVQGIARTGSDEYRTSFTSTVQRGTKIEVGRDGGVRFTLKPT